MSTVRSGVFSGSVFRFFTVNKVSKRVVLIISTIVGKRDKASKMANFPVVVLLTDGGHFLSLASPHNFLLIFHGSALQVLRFC